MQPVQLPILFYRASSVLWRSLDLPYDSREGGRDSGLCV
jgi:hypothetical protein